jgi:hypothetical protein
VKAPFDLGLRFVLRLILPGAVAAAALFPVATDLRTLASPGVGDATLFVAAGLVAGFTMLLLDMPIYMLLEGRRFWPERLRAWGIRRQAARLTKIRTAADTETDEARQVELDLLAAEYPLDRKTGDPVARYPTRLGNLLASFETYPNVKYGLDGVFHWSRLWVTIDKDLREELDSAQAIVDGAIYACAAFAFAALTFLAYAATRGPRPDLWLIAAAASAILSFACYRGALPRYAQYGQLFAGVFDQHRDKLKTTAVVADLDQHMRTVLPAPRPERETARAAWRFLRWHRYRRPGASANEVVRDWLP